VTLPASFYTNPAALRLEKQHILYNTWQVGGGLYVTTACAKPWEGGSPWFGHILTLCAC